MRSGDRELDDRTEDILIREYLWDKTAVAEMVRILSVATRLALQQFKAVEDAPQKLADIDAYVDRRLEASYRVLHRQFKEARRRAEEEQEKGSS